MDTPQPDPKDRIINLVGASEAADILGVEVQRISRYSRHDRMPDVVAELAATPVWSAKDIEYFRDHGLPPDEPASPMKLAGTREAAEMLGVHKSQIGRWLRQGVFPEPMVRLRAGPVWKVSEIKRFQSTSL